MLNIYVTEFFPHQVLSTQSDRVSVLLSTFCGEFRSHNDRIMHSAATDCCLIVLSCLLSMATNDKQTKRCVESLHNDICHISSLEECYHTRRQDAMKYACNELSVCMRAVSCRSEDNPSQGGM